MKAISPRRLSSLLVCALALLPAAPALAAGDANQGLCPALTEASPGFRADLPDCRAYEQVTPAYKAGHYLFNDASNAGRLAFDGENVVTSGFGAFAGTEDVPPGGGASGATYVFSRSTDGWVPFALTPNAGRFPRDNIGQPHYSASATGALFELTETGQPIWSSQLYVRRSNGQFDHLSELISAEMGEEIETGELEQEKPSLPAAAADLDRVLISYSKIRWPGDSTPPGRRSLYEASSDGGKEPTLVAIKNAGPIASNLDAEMLTQCGARAELEEERPGAVSADGSFVVFTAEPCFEAPSEPEVPELYVRAAGEKTLAISSPNVGAIQGAGAGAEECDSTCATAPHKAATFQGASAGGTKVLFNTSQPLINADKDETTDLYEAELAGHGSSASVSHIQMLSVGGLGDATPGEGAKALGLVALSGDGARVYFVAEGALTGSTTVEGRSPEAQAPTPGSPNLYMVDSDTGATKFLATLAPEDGFDWECGCVVFKQATADGRFLTFASFRQLTADDTSGGLWQLFQFDAEKDRLVRVSIGNEGFNNDGNTSEDEIFMGSTTSVGPDGSVFFSSSGALTSGATADPNHLLRNVYEYSDGHVYLIAPGSTLNFIESTGSATKLWGTDETGTNVFFATSDSLVPSDVDTQVDLYDARENGGFPERSGSSCVGEGCQGATPGVAPSPPPRSSKLGGEGNLKPKHHKKKKHHKKNHHKKNHHKKNHHQSKGKQGGRA